MMKNMNYYEQLNLSKVISDPENVSPNDTFYINSKASPPINVYANKFMTRKRKKAGNFGAYSSGNSSSQNSSPKRITSYGRGANGKQCVFNHLITQRALIGNIRSTPKIVY